jgi:DNA repair ATPase RecN
MIAAVFLLLGSASAYGQLKPVPTPPPPEPPSVGPSKPDSSSPDFGSPESEMKAKRMLSEEKKQYDENLARAREAADLATQLAGAYEAKQAFNSADTKKLERLEKITKKIRNEAGGSETDPDVKEIPSAMDAAVKRVAELADELRKLVESTPRHVISASVIDEANKLLGVIQHVRYGRQ